jgi:hypothetical protein
MIVPLVKRSKRQRASGNDPQSLKKSRAEKRINNYYKKHQKKKELELALLYNVVPKKRWRFAHVQ